jgi:hypothetical protein
LVVWNGILAPEYGLALYSQQSGFGATAGFQNKRVLP